MNRTNIEYLDYSWNPIAMRCTAVSAGCANCWHLAMADRLAANPQIANDIRGSYRGDIGPRLIRYRLDEPERIRSHSVIGAQFMGDLFHDDIPHEYVGDVWQTMSDAPQHRFLVLTKRPGNMLKWFRDYVDWNYDDEGLSNVWLGVTVENQAAADERIPLLLQVPAAVRWVSAEPLLEAIDIGRYGACLQWVVAGCESGPRHRHADFDWFRSLRDQCQAAGVPYFLKQAEINGKVAHMPALDGVLWDQMPEGLPMAR